MNAPYQSNCAFTGVSRKLYNTFSYHRAGGLVLLLDDKSTRIPRLIRFLLSRWSCCTSCRSLRISLSRSASACAVGIFLRTAWVAVSLISSILDSMAAMWDCGTKGLQWIINALDESRNIKIKLTKMLCLPVGPNHAPAGPAPSSVTKLKLQVGICCL